MVIKVGMVENFRKHFVCISSNPVDEINYYLFIIRHYWNRHVDILTINTLILEICYCLWENQD